MTPKQLGDGLQGDHAGAPLEGKIVSVQPAGSPVRSLHSHLDRRLNSPAENESAEARKWPAGLRVLFMVGAGLLAWAVAFGLWSVAKVIF